MEVEFICINHGARTPKNAKAGGLAVDLVCDVCGKKCSIRYLGEDGVGISKEEVYPEIYGEKK